MVDQIDEPLSWEMRKIMQVKQNVMQAATTINNSSADSCEQFTIDMEADEYWTCDATNWSCKMTDKFWKDVEE